MSSAQETVTTLFDATRSFLQQQAELYGEDFFLPKKVFEKSTLIPIQEPDAFLALKATVNNCQKCPLHKGRKNAVFGSGKRDARLMIVGEAPGAEEDIQGLPFVGAAGQLLDKILQAVNFRREDVFITNIIKCRPPQNRDPQPEEIKSCIPYLWKQIQLIQPQIILAMGRFAGQVLLGKTTSISQMRGQIHSMKGISVLVTYHPAALLRNASWKRPTWEDVKLLRQKYDELSTKNK